MRARLGLALVFLWASSGCAQSVVRPMASDGDGSVSSAKDASGGFSDASTILPSSDASISPSDASSAGDAGAQITGDASSSGSDAGAPNVRCMRQYQEDIQVPGPAGLAGFQNVRALAFDGQRRLYVLSRAGPPYVGWVTVLEPAPSHAVVRTFGRDEIGAAQDLTVDDLGNVHVVSWDPDGQDLPLVQAFDAQGNFAGEWEANGAGSDEVWSLARDDAGRIYAGGLVVFRYDPVGTYLDAIGRFGGAPGQIGLARGLAYDPRGFVWVADLVHNTIHQYDVVTKSHLIEIGGRGAGPGLFDADAASDWRWGPTRVALDANGAIYANDPFASRIQKLSRQGTFLGDFSFGNSTEIGPIQVEPLDGTIYVGRGTAVAIVCPL